MPQRFEAFRLNLPNALTSQTIGFPDLFELLLVVPVETKATPHNVSLSRGEAFEDHLNEAVDGPTYKSVLLVKVVGSYAKGATSLVRERDIHLLC